MCPSCSDYLDSLAGCSAKVASKWTCPLCGPQEFAKEADPPMGPSLWPEIDAGAVVIVVIVVALALMAIFGKGN